MYEIVVYNKETKEYLIEKLDSEKDVDSFVNDLHNVYGDLLKIEIKTIEEIIDTKTQSIRPPCPMANDPDFDIICEYCDEEHNQVI